MTAPALKRGLAATESMAVRRRVVYDSYGIVSGDVGLMARRNRVEVRAVGSVDIEGQSPGGPNTYGITNRHFDHLRTSS